MKRFSTCRAGEERGAFPRALGAIVVTLGLVSMGLVSMGGCLTTTAPSEKTRPTLLTPRWQDKRFAAHLAFFRSALPEGGSADAGPVGDYVSAQMRAAWLQPAVESRYRLRRAPSRPLGYAGYVGGKHPPVATEAVLVCADLGGSGSAGTPAAAANADSSGSGSPNAAAPEAVEAAALLEVARVYGLAAQYTLMPERSVIFTLWSRGPDDDPLAGLREYVHRPTWRLDAVRAVIYVGLPARLRPDARALLAEHGIALYIAHAPSPAPSATAPPRPASPSDTASADDANAASQERAAVLRARRLAQRVHERLRAATLTGGKIMPGLGDTLRVPNPQR